MVEILVAQQPVQPASSAVTAATAAVTTQPQIIVIPQSLLQQSGGANKKPILRVSPSVAPPTNTINTSVMAAPKISLKRPLPPLVAEDKKPLLEEENPPVRKRANLDHLTPEEKLMRRKLKNRVAAQNARDKKRAKIDEMEGLIQSLQEENQMLRELNQKLSRENSQLRGGEPVMVKEEMPPSPLSLPRSPPPPPSPPTDPQQPHHPVATTTVLTTATTPSPQSPPPPPLPPSSPGAQSARNQPVVVSRVSEPAAPTADVLLPKEQTREMAAGRICLFWTCLGAVLAATAATAATASGAAGSTSSQSQRQAQQTLASASSSKPRLPLKKRGSLWWGPQQRSWNPRQSKTTT